MHKPKHRQQGIPIELLQQQVLAVRQAGYSFPDNEPLLDLLFDNSLNDANRLISVKEAGKIFKLCKTVLNEDSYGLDSKPSQAKGYIKPVFLGTINCSTFGEMLHKQTELVSYMALDNEFAISEACGQVNTGFTRTSYPDTVSAELIQANDILHLYWWYRSYCWFISEPIRLNSVDIMGPKNRLADKVAALFGCAVNFQQASNRIQFDPGYLKKRVERTAQEVEFFCEDIGAACEQVPEGVSTAQSVQNILSQLSLQDPISLESTAKRLHCSRQTLIRRLRSEGTSFQAIKDHHRLEAASKMLACEQLSITEISDKLGFANSPAFTRAYRKWRGVTPSRARQQLLQAQSQAS